MDTVEGVVVVGAVAVVAYVVVKKLQQGGGAVVSGAPPPGGGSILDGVSYGGVPIGAVGQAAASAPAWLKVASFPVGVTAVTYQAVSHPVDTAKAIGSTTKSVVNRIGSWF